MPRDGEPRDQERGSALRKALAVLETVLAEPGPLGLTDLGQRLGLPKQSVHRIVRQLEQDNLLRREPVRDRFVVGPRLNTLALTALGRSFRDAPRRAVLEQIVETVGETCNVGVLDGSEVVYLDRVECDWPLRTQLRAGSRVPLHCTGMGKLFLATLPARARRRIIESLTFTRYTDNTITDPESLEAALKIIRRNDYAINDQENAIGLIGLAVPIRDTAGRVIAALAVHAPEPRMSLDRAKTYLPTLRAAAARLGKALTEESGEII